MENDESAVIFQKWKKLKNVLLQFSNLWSKTKNLNFRKEEDSPFYPEQYEKGKKRDEKGKCNIYGCEHPMVDFRLYKMYQTISMQFQIFTLFRNKVWNLPKRSQIEREDRRALLISLHMRVTFGQNRPSNCSIKVRYLAE